MDRAKIREAGTLKALLIAAVFVLDASTANAAVEISAAPTANMTCSSGVCTPTAKKAVLNVTDLTNMLATGDVTIKSDTSSKDIEIDAALSWTSTRRLTLDSYHAIAFNKPVVVAGTGAITITTNDGGLNGDFSFVKQGHVEFWDLASKLIVNGNTYTLVGDLNQIALDIRHNPNSFLALAKSIRAKHRYPRSPIDHGFEGTFEGLGNTIAHLKIHSTGLEDIGLFSSVIEFSAMIRDLGLPSVSITSAGVHVGALVGSLAGGTIQNCYATGEISSDNAQYVGGLVGVDVESSIVNSHSEVVIAHAGSGTAGGLVGQLIGDCNFGCAGTIEGSYATGSVTGGDGSVSGGLIGYNFGGAAADSYAAGTVSGGVTSSVGGLIGSNADNSGQHTAPRLTSVYATGSVAGGSGAMIGGLIGSDVVDATNANLYWDLDTSGISDPSKGAGNIANDPGITGLSDVQFKSGLPSGFDKNAWKRSAAINNGYPYLIDNPPR